MRRKTSKIPKVRRKWVINPRTRIEENLKKEDKKQEVKKELRKVIKRIEDEESA